MKQFFVHVVLFQLLLFRHRGGLTVTGDFSHCRNLGSSCKEAVKTLSTQRKEIYFGLMLSFHDLSSGRFSTDNYDDGHDIAPAAYLAVKHVNSRTDILQDYEVKIVRLDGGCDVATRTAIGFNKLMCSCDPIVGIIGPTCEKSSRIVSRLTNRDEFSMITLNYGGSDESVGDYNYSFGILAVNSKYGEAIDRLLRLNNWTNPAMLYTGLIWSVEIDLLYSLSGDKYNFSLSSAIYDSFIPLQQIKDSYARIIIIFAPPEPILRVLCLALHKDMLFPNYQWIFPELTDQDLHEVSFKYNGIVFNCSAKEINASLYGNINILFDAFTPNRTADITTEYDVDLTIDEYYDLYEQETVVYSERFGTPSCITQWAKPFYDAVWGLAFALNDSLANLNESITEFKTGSKVLADSIRERLIDNEVVGVTGNIEFDQFGYNKHGILSVYQYDQQVEHNQNVSKTRIAVFQEDKIMFLANNTPYFVDGSFKVFYLHMDIRITAGVLTITAVSLILVICAQFVNVYHRNHKVIKASSPTLNHLIFLGCYMIIIGVVFQALDTFTGIEPHLKEWLCNLVPCLLNVGITLFMGTVCIKTWRLNRLYTNSRKLIRGRIKFINDSFLAGFVSVLVVVDVFICITWNIVDPLRLITTETLQMQGNEVLLLVNIECHSDYTIYWLVVLLSPKVVLTLASFLLALSTKINRKEFRTSNVIVLTYLLAIIFGLAIPTYAIFHFTGIAVTLRIILTSICLNISVCICVLVLFLPLIHEVMKKCNCIAFCFR